MCIIKNIEKKSLQEPVIAGIKPNINSVIYHRKHITQPKLKVYFLKNALKTINEEVKEVNLIKQIKSIIISSLLS